MGELVGLKVYDGMVFVDGGDPDSPDDREVVFAPGHVDKSIFAQVTKKPIENVLHVFTRWEHSEGEDPDFAWWASEQTGDFSEPVTMAFSQ